MLSPYISAGMGKLYVLAPNSSRSRHSSIGTGKHYDVINSDKIDASVAVLIPCYNEDATISTVVGDFQYALPEAQIFVYDNNSSDQTAMKAHEAGAYVQFERRSGKGNVVRRMFSDIDADIYVLIDGDDTYDVGSVRKLIQTLLDQNLDMVNGSRVSISKEAYRFGHQFGNRLLTSVVAMIFENRFTDMLSGYRVFSRRFVKSFPALSTGFEIETELTVHALELRMPVDEIPTPYKDRPENSESKLRTYRDGLRILRTIAKLVKDEKPLLFFSTTALIFAIISISLIARECSAISATLA